MNRLALSKHAIDETASGNVGAGERRMVQLPVILDVDGFGFGPDHGKSRSDDQCKFEQTNSSLSVMISSNTEHLSLSRTQHFLRHEFQE
jgi:hypothetical protein